MTASRNPFEVAACVVAAAAALGAGTLWGIGMLIGGSGAEARNATAMWLSTITLLFIAVYITLAGIRWTLEHSSGAANTDHVTDSPSAPAPTGPAATERTRLRAVPDLPPQND